MDNNAFEYTYSAQRQQEVEQIRKAYLPKEEDKMEQLRRLHCVPTQKAQMRSLAIGIIGALILGTGMSFCLTDLGAAIAGGMGLAAGANLNPERNYPSMFEPIHGSAPDIAGQGISNPMASVWAASQMLDFFGHEDWGKKVLDAIEAVLEDGAIRTPDIGGTSSTSQVGDAIAAKLI